MSSTDPSPSPRAPGLLRRTFRRHRTGMVLSWLVGSLVACGLAYLYIKPAYRAFTLIRVEPNVTDLYDIKKGPDNLEGYLQTQVQLINSPNVLTAAGTNPKVAVLERVQQAGDVVQELTKAINVMIRPNTYLIEVGMTSSNGYEAATIVNAVVDAFMEANGEWSDGMTRQQIKNLEQYQIDLRNQTDELERRWKALAAKGDIDPPVQGDGKDGLTNRMSITVEEYRQVRHDMNAVEIELAQAEAWLIAAKDASRKGEEGDQIERQVERRFKLDSEASRLLEEIKNAEVKLSNASRASSTPEDPAVKATKAELDALVTRFHQLRETRSPQIREMIVAGVDLQAPEREVREAQTAVKKLLARQAAMKAKYEYLNVKNRTMASDAVDIALIQDGRNTLKVMMDAVTRRLEQLRFESKGEARIRPVNPNGAMVPSRPISDHRGTVLALIPLIMLFGVVGLFVGVEAWSGPAVAKPKAEPIREV